MKAWFAHNNGKMGEKLRFAGISLPSLGIQPIDPASTRLLFWVLSLITAVGVTGMPFYFEGVRQAFEIPYSGFASFQLATWSNTLLAASTIVYLVNLVLRSGGVGKCATGLAALGAVGVVVGLAARSMEMRDALKDLVFTAPRLYEVTAVFTALAVVAYLIMEAIYRNRTVGAFVMPFVMCAVAGEIWLVSHGFASLDYRAPQLARYWAQAQLLAHLIGYGALGMAAAMGALYLVRYHVETSLSPDDRAVRLLPDLWGTYNGIFVAIAVGLAVFALAFVLAVGWAIAATGGDWTWAAKETWALLVLLTYGAFFVAFYARRMSGVGLAWWAILSFGATLICFLGVSLLARA